MKKKLFQIQQEYQETAQQLCKIMGDIGYVNPETPEIKRLQSKLSELFIRAFKLKEVWGDED